MLRPTRHGFAFGVWAVLLPAVPAPSAAELAFERIDTQSGLSHNSVYAIHQDHRGLMWFGTADGLNRYNGYGMVVYRQVPGDRHSLPSNTVAAIQEDARGRLWVATPGGLARLDPERGRFVRYPRGRGAGIPAGVTRDLLVDSRGRLWAASSRGLLRYRREEDRFTWVPLPEDPGAPDAAFALAEGPDGALWIHGGTAVSTDASLYRLEPDGSAGRRYRIEGHWFHEALLVDSRGRVWGDAPRPAVLDESRGTASIPTSEVTSSVHALLEDRDGAVWIGGSAGLHRKAPDGRIRHVLPDPEHRTWLHNYVRSIFRSRSGALWVGTYSGVYRHEPSTKPFFALRHDPNAPESLSADAVSAIQGGPDGGLWVGTFGGGLDRLDRDHRTVARHRHRPGDPASLPSDVVWDLEPDGEGGLWIGTQVGLARYHPAVKGFERIALPASFDERVTTIATGEDGRLWLGRGARVTVYEPQSGRTEDVAPTGTGQEGFHGLAESILAAGDEIWLGIGTSLDRYRPAVGTLERHPLTTARGEPLAGGGIWDLHRSPQGRGEGRSGESLWLATSTGLLRFDPATQGFRRFGVEHGLPGSVVYSILEDGKGRLWLGTNRGLCRFDPDAPEKERFRTYDQNDGVGTTEFNRDARYAAEDGTFYFGGVDGLVWFDPEAIRDNPYVPPVVVTHVEMGSRSGTRRVRPAGGGRLEVGADEESLSFEFAALSYTDPQRNRYAYRLEGFDEGWVQAGHRRFARYTRLPPGEYTFRVRGSNDDGVWNLEGASLPLTVHPAFWETSWFRALAVLALAGMLYALHRYRLARMLEMERLRVRIAGDLHDDLSSDLSGIALAADAMARQGEMSDDERRRLGRIRETAAHLVDGVRDMVWAIDPEHDTLEATVRRLRSVAERLLEGVSWSFRTDAGAREGAIDPATRRNLVLIFKEALHNAARHAEAGRVDVRLDRRGDGRLVLEVRDDGLGFDPSRARAGHGLAGMERRAREIGAELSVDSRPGEGTSLTLRTPVPRSQRPERQWPTWRPW